jgi:hypothetical protein
MRHSLNRLAQERAIALRRKQREISEKRLKLIEDRTVKFLFKTNKATVFEARSVCNRIARKISAQVSREKRIADTQRELDRLKGEGKIL